MGLHRKFPAVKPNTLNHAICQSLVALRHEKTPENLAEFYDPAWNYAGATFAALEPRDATAVTATDLIATTTLSVRIPPRAVRRILEEANTSNHLSELLSGLPEHGLESTTAQDFDRMCEFYDAVKGTLSKAGVKSPNPWVTASKLTARKRPDLFPVRDGVVCKYLGIQQLRDRAKDWLVFREILNNSEVAEWLEALPELALEAAGETLINLDTQPLRMLDAVLWRHAGGGGKNT